MIHEIPPSPESYRKSHRLLGPYLHRAKFSCSHFAALSDASRDRKLNFGEKARYFLHRLICTFCANYDKQMRALSAVLKAAYHEKTKLEPDAAFLNSLRKKLDEVAENDSSNH